VSRILVAMSGGVDSSVAAAILRAQRMNRDITTWTRGIDREQFNPDRRDLEWRRGKGIADDEVVVAFLGRVVMEKGLDVFADAIHALERRGVAHRVADRGAERTGMGFVVDG